MPKPLVLVVGAAGYTGSAIAKGILKADRFRLAILIRPRSINKPFVGELTIAGAELRIGDISEPTDAIEKYLKGVNIVISTVLFSTDQRPLFAAAKNVGVNRVIPSDFGPIAPKDTVIYEMKLEVRNYIKELGVPFTFIDDGWWLYGMFPPLHMQINTLFTPKYYVGSKDQLLVYSTFETIGALVERVIGDPRTMNQHVVVHDGEITTREVWAIAEKVSGERFEDYYKASDEDITDASKESNNMIKRITAGYAKSLYILGENTLANAETHGYLDARKLYPNVAYPSVEEEAMKFYATPSPQEYRFSEQDLVDVFKPESRASDTM